MSLLGNVCVTLLGTSVVTRILSVTAVQQLLPAFQLYHPHSGHCQSDVSVNYREAEFVFLPTKLLRNAEEEKRKRCRLKGSDLNLKT